MPATKGTSTQQPTDPPDKGKLLSQTQPDKHIHALSKQNPDLYQATKNTNNTIQTLINEIFPARPAPYFEWRFVITTPSGTDALPFHYCVIMPDDPEGVWNYAGILLTRTTILDKSPPSGAVSIDIKRQTVATTTWATLYKAGFNPQLASGKTYSAASKFAINSLFQSDILRVDVLSSGSTAVGCEVTLSGVYVMEAS